MRMTVPKQRALTHTALRTTHRFTPDRFGATSSRKLQNVFPKVLLVIMMFHQQRFDTVKEMMDPLNPIVMPPFKHTLIKVKFTKLFCFSSIAAFLYANMIICTYIDDWIQKNI